MAEWIVMPKLGLTMTEGMISGWRKSEGDAVLKGEILFEVETDKISNEIEAKADGVIRKILAREGEVEVLKPVAILGGPDEDISAMLAEIGLGGAAAEGAAGAAAPAPAAGGAGAAAGAAEALVGAAAGGVGGGGRLKASPRARKIAAELRVELAGVRGTGPEGRIVEQDVRDDSASRREPKVKATPTAARLAEQLGVELAGIGKEGRIRKADVYAAAVGEAVGGGAIANAPQGQDACAVGTAAAAGETVTRIPMTAMRKVIAKRMLESKQISPTVNYNLRVDTSNLALLREQLKDVRKVTYTDLLVKIVAKALLEHPLLNASVENQEIIRHHYAHIGVAVGLEDGLIVPVVKHAELKGLGEISEEVRSLADKAKTNRLSSEEMSGGTFTITNLGMYGMESFTPIVNQPEVAILGVNAIVDTPVAENGQTVIRPLMNLSLTADHRVVDGAVAAAFLKKLKHYIEKPALLLL